jgi:hypothetical protein
VNALVVAASGGALEKMEFATVVVADRDFGLKELVNGRAPALFEACWRWMRKSADGENPSDPSPHVPICCSSVSVSF